VKWLKKILSIFSRPKPHEEQELEREKPVFGKNGSDPLWREFLDRQLLKLRTMQHPGNKLLVAFWRRNGKLQVYKLGSNWLRAKEIYAAVAGNLYPGRMVVLKNDDQLLLQARRPNR